MNIKEFHHQLKIALRAGDKSQKELAKALLLHPNVLSHKLSGNSNFRLSQAEIKQIIKILAEWEVVTTKQQVLDWLSLVNLGETSFSLEEWRSAPLNRLLPDIPAVNSRRPSNLTFGSVTNNGSSESLPRLNLPTPPTSLVGREGEITQLKKLLKSPNVRLLTLVGPGGVGKTRLGLAVASRLIKNFAQGIFFVDLTQVTQAAMLIPRLAAILKLDESAQPDLLENLKAYLSNKSILLVLDNFEHLPAAAALIVSDLLTAAPHLKLLVTSRVSLSLYGEYKFSVPALSLPDLPPAGDAPDLAALVQSEAVRLFIARTRAVNLNFKLTVENSTSVANLCNYLEGWPLAIELAAAQSHLFSPQVLLTKLHESRLTLLVDGAQDLPPRHQALRNTIKWSYCLLGTVEQVLFSRLGVFAGKFSLEAVSAVCQPLTTSEAKKIEAADLLRYLQSLVHHQLLQIYQANGESPYFQMLETLREYTLEQLEAQDELETIRLQHANYYHKLAELAVPELEGPQQQGWFNQIEQAQPNFWAVLAWNEKSNERVEWQLRLVNALARFWYIRGPLVIGLEQVLKALNRMQENNLGGSLFYARAVHNAGRLAYRQVKYSQAQKLYQESLSLLRTLNSPPDIAEVLNSLGVLLQAQAELLEAKAYFQESLTIRQALNDKLGMASTLSNLGIVARQQGQPEIALDCHKTSIKLCQELGDKIGQARGLNNLGAVALWLQNGYLEAWNFFHQSVELGREAGDKINLAVYLSNLGLMEILLKKDYQQARLAYQESLMLRREADYKRGIANSLVSLALIAEEHSEWQLAHNFLQESFLLNRELGDKKLLFGNVIGVSKLLVKDGQLYAAVRLCGAATGLLHEANLIPDPFIRQVCEANLAYLRANLAERVFQAAWNEGQNEDLSFYSLTISYH